MCVGGTGCDLNNMMSNTKDDGVFIDNDYFYLLDLGYNMSDLMEVEEFHYNVHFNKMST